MIVSDPIIESLGILDRAASGLNADIHIYAKGEVEPSTQSVSLAQEVMQEFNPDAIVAIGGGSNMDLAKMAAASFAAQTNPCDLLGFDQIPKPLKPLICIPTTSGTGSESSASAVIMNSRTGMKAAALSDRIRPEVAIVDPELTLSCPPKLTAESGIDALTHAVEAYLSRGYDQFDMPDTGVLPYEGNHILGDVYAEKSIQLAGENFLRVVSHPSDIDARSGMALAANMGGVAFSNCGVTLAHALEYPIGNRYKISHGAGNGIVLPPVMEFFKSARPDRLAAIGALLGTDRDPDAAIEMVIQIRREAGLPQSLSEVGAKKGDLEELASIAFSLKRLMDLSPLPVTQEDLMTILDAAF